MRTAMIRLILYTGRFRDMGYETALSGTEPTVEEREEVDRLLASLRRGAPKGGFGIVVKLSQAGRAIEELLAVTYRKPLTAENEERLRAELIRLHRDKLPELLQVAGRAVSVSAAREEIRRGLDGWLVALSSLLPLATGPRDVTANSRQRWWLDERIAAAAAVVAIGLSVVVTASHWVGGQDWPPLIVHDGPDFCRPHGAEDAEVLANEWLALDESIGRRLLRDDPFAALPADSARRLRALVPADAPDTLICQMRRALAAIHRDLAGLRDVAQGDGLGQARSLNQYSSGELLKVFEEFADLVLPERAQLCHLQEAVCLPMFMEADVETMEAIVKAYGTLLRDFRPDLAPTWLASVSDTEELERALEASGLRRDEIILRGELHRAGQSDSATALFDPLKALIDCPRQNSCVAHAARRLRAEP